MHIREQIHNFCGSRTCFIAHLRFFLRFTNVRFHLVLELPIRISHRCAALLDMVVLMV